LAGLAEAFHAEGNQVIISGRRKDVLDKLAAANPGMKAEVFDIADAASIRPFAEHVLRSFPGLNAVIHNAGIMRMEDLRKGDAGDAEAIVATNLLGPIRLNSALLPALLTKPQAMIMTVSSGLAFVPLAPTPTYCATEAAIHSYTQSLRYQLKQSSVQVIELAPPYVQTELLGPGQASDPNAMPLQDFIAESMQILRTSPDVEEVLVERVKRLRNAEASGNYQQFFQRFNEQAAASHTTL
jgi:uncharacterized oxidoreductase